MGKGNRSEQGRLLHCKSCYEEGDKDNAATRTCVPLSLGRVCAWLAAFRRVRDGQKHAMKDFAAKLTAQLGELTTMVRSDLSGEVRKKVNQLIIIDVHARDIIDTFVRDSVMDAREFAWESQLRFYWDRQQDDILIRQVRGIAYDCTVRLCMGDHWHWDVSKARSGYILTF